MEKLIQGLETVASSVKKSSQPSDVSGAIQSLRGELAKLKGSEYNAVFQTLDEELAIWLKKIDVILKDQAGREGMVKHARHWMERLKTK